jgi:alkanesulfonate monooxygenase SsuD/methylene tetrahydromethanopterin reductase-like flavin-dependent oxidoreductase (luciferase family)
MPTHQLENSMASVTIHETSVSPDRRSLLKWTGALATGHAQTSGQTEAPSVPQEIGVLRKGMFSYMLASEQFPTPELLRLGAHASRAGFHVLSTSDHLQPWQANEGHVGQAWVTMGALGAQTRSWMGTTVTCPTMRYNPAVVAEAFATMSHLYPGRVFLGVGSGEALNEQIATGEWPKWQERWDRLIEAITVIRQLWTG